MNKNAYELIRKKKIEDEIELLRNERIEQVGKYFYETGKSTREISKYFTENYFPISNKTVNKYIKKYKERHPDLGDELDKKVDDNTEKSFMTDKIKKEILIELELLFMGYVISDIAKIVDKTYSSVQRDLTKRLKKLSDVDESYLEYYEKAKQILKENQNSTIISNRKKYNTKDIKNYLKNERIKEWKTLSDYYKDILNKLIEFYFDDIKVENLTKLKQELESVKYLLSDSFYQKLTEKIEADKMKKILEEKENSCKTIKILLLNDIKSYEELSNISGLTIEEIKKILKSKKLVLEYDENTFIKIGEKVSILDETEAQKKEIPEEKRRTILMEFDEFFDIYLNSRYASECLMPSHCRYPLKSIYKYLKKDEYKENFPEDILEQLAIKGNELKYTHDRKDSVVIRDAKIIKIVKPEITNATPFILSKLELVTQFFEYFGNIEKMTKEIDSIPSYNSILSSLMLPQLREYLTDEANLKLSKYLDIEKMYQSINYIKRVGLVRSVFLKYSGNLYSLIDNKDEEELVLRILSDKIVKQEFGEDIYNKTLILLEEYKKKSYVIEELQKVKTKALQ